MIFLLITRVYYTNKMNSVDELYIDLNIDQNEYFIFYSISTLINIICEYFNM